MFETIMNACGSMSKMMSLTDADKKYDGIVFRKDQVREQKFDMSNLDILECLLEKNGFKYFRRGCLDGEQICVLDRNGNQVCDTIIHSGSYGVEAGLIEGGGEPFYDFDIVTGELIDEVTGYLTGEQAYEMLDDYVYDNDLEDVVGIEDFRYGVEE